MIEAMHFIYFNHDLRFYASLASTADTLGYKITLLSNSGGWKSKPSITFKPSNAGPFDFLQALDFDI